MYECALQGQVGQYTYVTRMDRLDVDVQVLPDRIEPIEGEWGTTVVTGEGRFPVGGTVTLLCNSTVGDPPSNLYWIVKRANDTDYIFLNDTDQSQPSVSESCQLRRTSRIVWTVTSAYEETLFVCAVGPTNISSRLNTTFTLFAISCEGDCTVVTTAVPNPSTGITSGVIAAAVVTPLIFLAMLITLVVMLKFPGARAVLCKRKSIETKVKPYASRLDIPQDLNGTGTSAPPTGTSLTNGHGSSI
ncbi:uncharacterized protein LOC110445899 [Mizuhopecten yessoensis]|uniref:uncharacterized protein LOC110445899 n=1 Tax=Mizuhopecten yessoensis TaxID=6573 RepID=UPI000B45E29A|nr:uncharacterized protein LOC110445899 [Mizuhopecten yessoensis]